MTTPQVNYIEKTIEEFRKTALYRAGGCCWECCDYESIVNEVETLFRKALQDQRSEIVSCLPGTVVLDQEFYSEENQNSKEFNKWLGAVEYHDQFLTNLKEKGLLSTN